MGAYEAAGETDEWYTPKYVFDALGVTFDMDVAHPRDHRFTSVPAMSFLYEAALEADWCGFVWMNPPFGHQSTKRRWLAKFFDHGDGIALTPDRTSAPWFREAWPRASAVMFTPKIKFVRPDGSIGTSPGTGTCLWGIGDQAIRALNRAASNGLGITATPTNGVQTDDR